MWRLFASGNVCPMKSRIDMYAPWAVLRTLVSWLMVPFALLPISDLAAQRLSIEPSSVTIAGGRSDHVLVRIESGASRGRGISVTSPASIRTSVRSLGRSGPWILELKAEPGFEGEANAIVQTRGLVRVLAAPLAIKAAPARAPGSVIEAELSFEGETLLDGSTRPMLLRLSNPSDLPVRYRLSTVLPSFIRLGTDANQFKHRRDLSAHSTVMVHIPIQTDGTADHPVISGKHKVAVMIATSQAGTPTWRGQSVAATELEIGVPGMAEVQGVLQVPSFLLLPGFLLVAAFGLTSRILGQSSPTSEGEGSGLLSLGWGAGHWLVAISVSMGIVWVYPNVTDVWLGSRRNILYGFDLSDVIRVWMLSIGLGIVVALVTKLVLIVQVKRAGKMAFSTDLQPFELLERLERLGLPTKLPFAAVNADDRLYSLQTQAGAGKVWACSAITLSIVDPSVASLNRGALAKNLKTLNAKELRMYLQGLVDDAAVRLDWAVADGVSGVAIVDVAKMQPEESPKLIIRQSGS